MSITRDHVSSVPILWPVPVRSATCLGQVDLLIRPAVAMSTSSAKYGPRPNVLKGIGPSPLDSSPLPAPRLYSRTPATIKYIVTKYAAEKEKASSLSLWQLSNRLIAPPARRSQDPPLTSPDPFVITSRQSLEYLPGSSDACHPCTTGHHALLAIVIVENQFKCCELWNRRWLLNRLSFDKPECNGSELDER